LVLQAGSSLFSLGLEVLSLNSIPLRSNFLFRLWLLNDCSRPGL
jgi:hypothetical protein